MKYMLVFDGMCSICRRVIGALVTIRLIRESEAQDYLELEGDLQARVDAAGIRNEMVILDPDSGETRTGVQGLLWMVRDRLPAWVRVPFSIPPISTLVNLAYRTFAFNRRIFAPPPNRGIACACDPEFHTGYRTFLIVLNLTVAAIVAGLFGRVLYNETGLQTDWGISGLEGTLEMLVITGSCWLLPLLAALKLSGEKRWNYVGHVTLTMATGFLVLMPAVALSPLVEGRSARITLLISAAASCLLMVRMTTRRMEAIGLGRGWAGLWLGSLGSCATGALILLGWV